MDPINSLEIFNKKKELYGNVRVPGYMLDLIEYALDNVSELIEILGFKRPLILYSNKGSHWADYSVSTWDQPVITIIVKQHKKCDQIGDSLTNALAHELVHAALEKFGITCILYKHDEEFVQELADKYSDGYLSASDIKKEIIKEVKMFKKVEDFFVNWTEDTPENIKYTEFYKRWSF